MSEPWVYLNGEWLPQSRAGLTLNDAGFVLGVTVTSLVRTFQHELFRWSDHLKRFRGGTKEVHLRLGLSDAEITELAEEAVRRNATFLEPEQELCLVMFATPGRIGYYGGTPGSLQGPLTFGIHTFPLPFERYRDWIEDGAVLRVPAVRQVPAASIPPTIKQRSRMHWWRAEHEVVSKDPAAKALLLNENDHVTETALANFLIVRRGRVATPARTEVLPGVSLKVVAEICAQEGIAFERRSLTLEECLAADEALVCGTAFCLAGVRQLDDHRYRFPGPMLRRLLVRWNAIVGLDIHKQIRDNSTRNPPTEGELTAVVPSTDLETPAVSTPTPTGDFHQVLSAVALAARAHQGQIRKDGKTPYVSHVFRVCLIIAQRFGISDPQVLQAALLHDTIEDTTTDFDDLAEHFSPTVAQWAAWLTKDKRLPDDARERAYRKMLRQAPWQVQVAKLADVYDNLLDSTHLDAAKREHSHARARVYLDGLASVKHPDVQRCWKIVDALYHGLHDDNPGTEP